jgi:hypothetical protein
MMRSERCSQKYTARFADTIRDDRALRCFEIERRPNEVYRNLEQLLGQRHQFVDGFPHHRTI